MSRGNPGQWRARRKGGQQLLLLLLTPRLADKGSKPLASVLSTSAGDCVPMVNASLVV